MNDTCISCPDLTHSRSKKRDLHTYTTYTTYTLGGQVPRPSSRAAAATCVRDCGDCVPDVQEGLLSMLSRHALGGLSAARVQVHVFWLVLQALAQSPFAYIAGDCLELAASPQTLPHTHTHAHMHARACTHTSR
eukprot:815919-Pleurochrysis_carterae.AAC.1